MYYLVIQTMGLKKCIDVSNENVYESEHLYDCLQSKPFDDEGKKALSVIFIRCTSAPEFLRRAIIYSD